MLILLLAIPLDLSFAFSVRDDVEGRMTIGWLFGLVRFPVSLTQEKKEAAEKKQSKAPRKKRKPEPPRVTYLIRSGEFWRWSNRLLKRLLGHIKVYSLFLRVRLGLGDPADTGRLWAVAGPISALLASIPVARINIEPNFMQAELQVESEGQIRIYPIRLIAVAVSTALSPTTWRLFPSTGKA